MPSSSPATEAVVAGSKAFAVAMLAPVTSRLGTRPRIAADAAQALSLCHGPGGLVVIEYQGEGSLAGIERLLRDGGGVRVVAALAPEHAAAEAPLRALGVEPARWDGRPDGVLGAVERMVRSAAPVAAATASPVVNPPPLAVPPPPPPPPSAGPPPLARKATAPPPDLSLDDAFDVSLDDAFPGEPPAPAKPEPPRGGATVYVPPPPAVRLLWPAQSASAADAQASLERALSGGAHPGDALDGLAAGIAGGLSELERAALGDGPMAVDPGPIRTAAVMRLRVASARASAPAGGAEVDRAAVQAMLADLDATLAAVNGLAAGAPPEIVPGVEAVRNALVREAIDFSDLAQRVASAGAVAATAARAPARPAQARVLAVSAEPGPRRPWGLWVMLALALAAGGGYHGWYRWHVRHKVVARLGTLPGAPQGMVLLPGARAAPRILIPLGGATIDPAEVERFKAQQRAQGNEVREIDGGGLELRRVDQGAKERTP
ncbi:hypothetical protein [Anaeromyxobacter dehalogenans]|uniref:Uncharacterized protein n=1 Tax=Anaeromyxobacter dehalogenans (strain 2CP-C) TaxID=290397 RepID=Q2INT2_ANADE|nr:hypothetical protein [Anaeromyxobacter dehalogenans]ABC80467.1 hypothetical protein Adeh_0691 [Anaeromyxobacter dehalogenans 2CP-C]